MSDPNGRPVFPAARPPTIRERMAQRVRYLLDVILDLGPGPLIVVIVMVVAALWMLALLRGGGGSGQQAATSGGDPPAAVDGQPAGEDSQTDPEDGSADGAAGDGLVGTYVGEFTEDIGPVGRIYQVDPTETGRDERANEVTLVVAEDGAVTGTLRWEGEQQAATDLCTTVRVSSESGTFEGTVDAAGALEGVATLTSSGSSQSTCGGEVGELFTFSGSAEPFPFTATIEGDTLVGEITGIFRFTAQR